MEKIQKSNKLLFVLLFALAILAGAFSYILNKEDSNVLADNIKTYTYQILKSEGETGYTLLGYYTDDNYYILEENSYSIEALISKIKEDINGVPCTATITFFDVEVGNENVLLSTGDFIFKGKISFINISGNACFSLTGDACVTTQDFEIINYATAPVFMVDSNTSALQMETSIIRTQENAIIAQNSAIVTLMNSQIYSNAGYALKQEDAVVQILSSSTLKTQGDKSAIFSCGENGKILINAGQISAENSSYAIDNDGSEITIYGRTVVSSLLDAIKTNIYITASYNSENLTNTSINLYYCGQLGAYDTLIVKDFDAQSGTSFNILNLGYNLRTLAQSLYIAKVFKVYYHANCESDFTVPVDSEEYYNFDTFNIQYMSENVRRHYMFLGYAKTDSATEPEFTVEETSSIDGEDVHLYAVWEPVTYNINFYNVEDEECSNVQTYDYNKIVVINKPVRKYYTFTGWLVNGEIVVENLTLPYGDYENLTLTAQFELTKFKIEYQNLTEEQIEELGLQTTYTIQSESLNLSTKNFTIKGYSFIGLFDKNNQEITNEIVNFGINQTNNFDFVVGDTLKIVVDVKPYFNGFGTGDCNNPLMLDSSEQLYNLFFDQKINSSMIYIKIVNDINLDKDIAITLNTLNNLTIDGNGKKIIVKKLCKYLKGENVYYSIFPNLKNVVLKNITIEGFTDLTINTTLGNVNICQIAQNANQCYFEDVVNSSFINIECTINNGLTTAYFSGFVSTCENSVFNNCAYKGSIIIQAEKPAKSVYVCAYSTNASNTLLANCYSGGKFNYTTKNAKDNQNTVIYLAGFSVADEDNMVANCLFEGEQKVSQKDGNQAIYSGILIAIKPNNTLVNNVSIGKYIFNGQDAGEKANNIVSSLLWSVFEGVNVEHCTANINQNAIYQAYNKANDNKVIKLDSQSISDKDYYYICNQSLSKAQSYIDSFINQHDSMITLANTIKATYWADKQNGEEPVIPQDKIVIRIYNNVNNDVKVYILNRDADNKVVLANVIDEYLFEDFYLDKNYKIKFEDLDSLNADVVLYAKYISYQNYTLRLCIAPFIAIVVDLILIIVFIIYCERPRRVIFVQDGLEINGAMVKWGKKIEMPKEYGNVLWFKDVDCKYVLNNYKMPFVFGAYKLFSFTGAKGEAIQAMIQKKIEYKDKLKNKQKDKTFKQNLKREKIKYKKSKVQLEIEKAGITIVKKDVQILRQDNK